MKQITSTLGIIYGYILARSMSTPSRESGSNIFLALRKNKSYNLYY